MHAVANDACDGRLTSLDFAQIGRGACTGNSTCLCDVGFVGVSCEESLSTEGCLFNCSSRGSCNENQVRICAIHFFPLLVPQVLTSTLAPADCACLPAASRVHFHIIWSFPI